jgi:hypothetical protein
MKRMHVHVSVEEIGKAVDIYSAPFTRVAHQQACCVPQQVSEPKAAATCCTG